MKRKNTNIKYFISPLHFREIWILVLFLSSVCHAQLTDFAGIDFQKADSVALRYEGFNIRNTDQLVDSLTSPFLEDVQKFRAIFRWITDNIRYDYDMYEKIIRQESKPKKNKKAESRLAQRLSKKKLRRMIQKRKAVCSGYATLLDYMCSIAGIESVFLGGHARDYNVAHRRPNHAWNAARLNGKWYLCDVTWASGWVDPSTKRFIKDFNNAYFLTDPSLLICNHYPTKQSWTLLKDPPTFNEFFGTVFKAGGYIENKINMYSPSNQSLRIKLNDSFQLKFTSNADWINPEATIIITNKGDNKNRQDESVLLTRNKIGEYVLDFPLTVKGNFYVRIYINNLDTFVYGVTVF